MLEVGKTYKIVRMEAGENGPDESYSYETVAEVQWPLVRFKSVEGEEIINLTSPFFVRAERWDD